jgi:hypothetical protein
MATNFLDQVLSLTGLKLPDTESYSSSSVHQDKAHTGNESDERSSVERYQQKKNAKASLTGTARYLAKKQQQLEETAAKLTSVDKYLTKQQHQLQKKAKEEATVLANMTGVEKYLFKLSTTTIVAITQSATLKQSSVDKYLAKQKQQTPVGTVKNEAVKLVDKANIEAVVAGDITQNEPTAKREDELQQDTLTADAIAELEVTTEAVIDLVDEITRCQAATMKGTQCRRKTGLEALDTIVDDQAYKFSVCSQHHNDDFVPFAEFLQKN